MGTNNPSDEQLEVVTTRIVEISQALYPYVALDENSYFDDAGYDEEMASQLTAKLKEYIQNAEDVEPSPLEDHPQPRRMARYLLEGVDYAVLEVPLSSKLLSGEKVTVVAIKPAGGGGELILGMPRAYVMAAAAAVAILIVCVVVFLMLGPGGGVAAAAGGGKRGGRGGRGRMNKTHKVHNGSVDLVETPKATRM